MGKRTVHDQKGLLIDEIFSSKISHLKPKVIKGFESFYNILDTMYVIVRWPFWSYPMLGWVVM